MAIAIVPAKGRSAHNPQTQRSFLIVSLRLWLSGESFPEIAVEVITQIISANPIAIAIPLPMSISVWIISIFTQQLLLRLSVVLLQTPGKPPT
jgi:hypothetical protein